MFDEDGSNANRTTGPAVRDQNLFCAILGLGKALVALDWQYFGIQSFLIFLSPSWKGVKVYPSLICPRKYSWFFVKIVVCTFLLGIEGERGYIQL